MPVRESKRQNFNVTPEQEAELEQVRQALEAPTVKEAILRSAPRSLQVYPTSSAIGSR